MVSANTDVAANTAKIGITTEQADAIAANTVKTNPWSVNSTNDSISYEKKVVIGSLASVNTPGLTVYGTTSGPTSPTANFVRSQTRNNVLQFETSEEDNGYIGSVGIIGNGGNTNRSNLFSIGINDGESWNNPLRIYYDNKAFRLGFGSDGISDINNFGTSSISLGTNSFATGDYSSTLGTDNTASGLNSTALGLNSQATADGAIVLGTNSIASGDNSTAMGLNVKASGSGSTAIGLNSTASGDFSNTFGVDIEAYSFAETVVGRFNTIYEPAGGVSGYNNEDRLFVVGKGESDTNRSDALIIKKSGEMSLEGNQIKNLQDPTENQDAVTLAYINALIAEAVAALQGQIDNAQIGSITDVDGNTYNSLTYGDQVWTVENAAMVTYRDGTPIPQVTDNTEWESLTTGAWSYYNNDSTRPRLYNWFAVMGIHDTDPNTPNKEFAPEGWHVPSNAEWTTLENHLISDGYNYDDTTEGNKIAKSMASVIGWNTSTETGAIGNDQSLNNRCGFNAFSDGDRSHYDGYFYNEGATAVFWSSPNDPTSGQGNLSNIWIRFLSAVSSGLNRYDSFNNKQQGFSVRFVRD